MAATPAKSSRRASTAAKSPRRTSKRRDSVESLRNALNDVAMRLHEEGALRQGPIVFRSADGSTRDLVLDITEDGIRVDSEGGPDAPAILEVFGDPGRVESIIRGKKDARKEFFAGGIRVRGDMYYLSDLGMRLGFLDKPIV